MSTRACLELVTKSAVSADPETPLLAVRPCSSGASHRSNPVSGPARSRRLLHKRLVNAALADLPRLACGLHVALLFLLLGACAQIRPITQPSAMIDPDLQRALAASIAEHEKSALREEAAGELLAASAQWHVLSLLAPEQERYRAQLTAVRTRVRKTAAESLASGLAAYRRGDLETASNALLGVLALSPDEQEAQKVLREIERQRISAIQAERAARFKANYGSTPLGVAAASKTARPVAENDSGAQAYELEQSLELFKAGDTEGGLRDMRRYATAYPGDTRGRERLSEAVYRRAMELDERGKREAALTLLEQAGAVRGSTPPAWSSQSLAIRKALSRDYYEQAWRAYRTDVQQAIRLWETSLRYDPQNTGSALKLQEARRMQESLRRMDRRDPR